MHCLQPSGASRTSSRRRRIALRACQDSGRSGLLLLLVRPSAVRLFVALIARRCYWSWGSVAESAAARAAAGVAAAGGSGSGWVFRRGGGWRDPRLLVRGALRLVSQVGAIGG